jgi:hypothetical protein
LADDSSSFGVCATVLDTAFTRREQIWVIVCLLVILRMAYLPLA